MADVAGTPERTALARKLATDIFGTRAPGRPVLRGSVPFGTVDVDELLADSRRRSLSRASDRAAGGARPADLVALPPSVRDGRFAVLAGPGVVRTGNEAGLRALAG